MIMLIGVFSLIIKLSTEVGGMGNMINLASRRLDVGYFRIDPRIRYQFWNTGIALFAVFLFSILQQPGCQGISCAPTLKAERQIVIVAGILTGIFCFFISFEGVAIYAYYSSIGCDPLASGRIDNVNQLIPLTVIDLFSSLPGLS